jgi:hypothetical protein
MPSHKGIKPGAQPRSLRSVAEGNDQANFDAKAPEAETTVVDDAEKAQPTAGQKGASAADPQPFASLRGGK